MAAFSGIRTFLLWFLSLGVGLASLRFLLLGVEAAFPDPEMVAHIAERNLAFVLHISASPLALISGLLQFVTRLRLRHPWLHRWIGRLYLLSVLIGGLSGLVLALGMSDRPVAAAGFGLLALLWVGFTLRAVWLAMAGRSAQHRRWMLRSYALSFAAVTLRLELLPFFLLTDMEYGQITAYVAWLCWVPNLILAEWWLNRRATGAAGTAGAAGASGAAGG